MPVNSVGGSEAKGSRFNLLSPPSYPSLTHINTSNLWGSSMDFQKLSTKISEFIQNCKGHQEKWKISDVKEFAQGQKLVTFQGNRTASKSQDVWFLPKVVIFSSTSPSPSPSPPSSSPYSSPSPSPLSPSSFSSSFPSSPSLFQKRSYIAWHTFYWEYTYIT